MRRVIPIVLLLHLCSLLQGQTQQKGFPYIRNYTSREFKASSANYTAVQDHRGVMYFGNYRGVMEFDGANWNLIPTQRQATVRSLAVDSLGRVYVGGTGDFGYLQPDSMGRQKYHSLLDRIKPADANFSGVVRAIGGLEGAYFQVFETRKLYYYTPDTLLTYDLSELPDEVFLHLIHGYLHASPPDRGLLRLERGKFRPVPGGEVLQGLMPVAVTNLGPDEILLRAYQDGFYHLTYQEDQVELKRWRTEIDDELSTGIFGDFTRLNNGHLIVCTFKQGAFELDPNGKLVRHYHEEIGLLDNIVLGSYQDRQNSLWLMLSRGISRIEVTSPLSLYGNNTGLPGIVYATIRHQGKLYASTPLGVFQLRGNQFRAVPGLSEETWQFFSVPGEEGQPNHLLANTLVGLYEVRNGGGYPLSADDYYTSVATHPDVPNFGVALSGNQGARSFRYIRGKLRWTNELPELGIPLQDICLAGNGDLWAMPANQEGTRLIQLSPTAQGNYQVTRVFDSAQIGPLNGLYPLRGGLFVVSEEGVMKFVEDGFEIDAQLNRALAQPGVQTGYLVEDESGYIWVERVKGQQRWVEVLCPLPSGNFERDSLILRGLSDLEIWGEVYVEPEGLAWIGTPEGLYCYDTRYQDQNGGLPNPLIREVWQGEDSLLYGGTFTPSLSENPEAPVNLSSSQNSLTFHYVAPYFTQEGRTEYRYKLEGWEEEWSPWTTQLKKDYTLLPPGDYTFEVQARTVGHQVSGVARYAFYIALPWYRLPWAFAGYGLLAAFLIWGTVKLNTHRLHLKNEHLERLVFERTTEIWEQHKEIVKTSAALKRQKEAVAKQAALLEEKNKALNDALDQLKATQSQLVESEKMASLGQLTAGIAHEINNPINYVKNNVGPLMRDFAEIRDLFLEIKRLKEDRVDLKRAVLKVQKLAQEIEAEYLFEEMELLLKGIEEGARRTTDIVDGLKIFSRSEKDHFKLVDIHAGIDSTLTLLNNKLKDRIRVERNYEEMPVVECLPGKLNQVFMNILSNAIHAIDDQEKEKGGPGRSSYKGHIYISTKSTQGCLPGHRDCVWITIQDNGVGMPPEIKNRIFEPFFTTKDVGSGTGLGLSISFGIVEQHGGRIEVDSKKGEGSTFIIILPFRQEEQDETPTIGVEEHESENVSE